jgi:hypothetical protein
MFPEAGRVRVSSGRRPIWDPDGKRLYYRDANRLMVATIARDPALRVVSRETLFESRYAGNPGDCDVAKDGRFLMVETEASHSSLVVIPNWRTDLTADVEVRTAGRPHHGTLHPIDSLTKTLFCKVIRFTALRLRIAPSHLLE